MDAGLVGPDEFCMIKPHALLSLLIILCAFGATRSLAAVGSTWEYAQLTEIGTSVDGLRWSSPTSDLIDARDVKKLAEAMEKSGELPKRLKLENVNRLLQALGSMGWELVQVETKRDRPEGYDYRTYYFKRQTS